MIKSEKRVDYVHSVQQTIYRDEARLSGKYVSPVSDCIICDVYLEVNLSFYYILKMPNVL